jgi:hypothetical protein
MVINLDHTEQVNREEIAESPEWRRKHAERVVDDFSSFQEGDIEPTLGKEIKFLIFHEKSYIVYLDSENFVEWSTNDHYGDYPDDLGSVINSVGHLEALSMSRLSPEHRLPFRRLLGESLARALSERTSTNALAILDHAEKYLNARSRERARTWYLSAAAIATSLVMLIVGIFWLRRGVMTDLIGGTGFEIVLGAGAGSLGSLLSIITRSNEISMDASAGSKVHYLEAVARIVVGVAGACIVALAIKANLVLGSINAINSLALLIVICIIAGASERLVPNLIKQIEGRVSFNDEN